MTPGGTLGSMMDSIGRASLEAARVLAGSSTAARNAALEAGARAMRAQAPAILEANAADLASATDVDIDPGFIKLGRDYRLGKDSLVLKRFGKVLPGAFPEIK